MDFLNIYYENITDTIDNIDKVDIGECWESYSVLADIIDDIDNLHVNDYGFTTEDEMIEWKIWLREKALVMRTIHEKAWSQCTSPNHSRHDGGEIDGSIHELGHKNEITMKCIHCNANVMHFPGSAYWVTKFS